MPAGPCSSNTTSIISLLLFIDCGTLTTPANGFLVSSDGHLDGDNVVFGCLEGYVESGDSLRTCQSSGTWNGTPLSCSPIGTHIQIHT